MVHVTNTEIVLRLVLAMVAGLVVGVERRLHAGPAGLRTPMMVCVGSALIMITSLQVGDAYLGIASPDPARIAAMVVSGVGFLGAGTILRDGNHVKGLTTASALWVVAAMGLAVGAGLYTAAIVTLVGSMIILTTAGYVEARIDNNQSDDS